jgi:hypothetical protein
VNLEKIRSLTLEDFTFLPIVTRTVSLWRLISISITDMSFDDMSGFVETQAEVAGNLRSHNCNKLFLVPTRSNAELFGTNKTFVGDSLDFVETGN